MKKDTCKNQLLFFGVISLFGINSCQRQQVRKLSNKELSVITASCSLQPYPASLYFLDGDCSSCLAKAKEFDDRSISKGARGLILFKVSNPVMTKLYIKGILLQSCVILDSSNLFAKSFTINYMYEISEKGEIRAERPDKW